MRDYIRCGENRECVITLYSRFVLRERRAFFIKSWKKNPIIKIHIWTNNKKTQSEQKRADSNQVLYFLTANFLFPFFADKKNKMIKQ